jgi:hypothetical protein
MKRSARFALILSLGLLLGTEEASAQLTQSNFDQAISGTISASSRAAEVSRLSHVSGISVVRLRQIVVFREPGDEPDRAAISISAQKNSAGIARLRSALRSNPATRAALSARGIPLGRIVAAEVVGGGYLKVFIL